MPVLKRTAAGHGRRRLWFLFLSLGVGVALLALTLSRKGAERGLGGEAAPGARTHDTAGAGGALPPRAAPGAASPARASGSLRALRGVVVAAPDMTPLPEVRVVAGELNAPRAEAISDAEGLFELFVELAPAPEDPQEAALLDVDPPAGYWLPERPQLATFALRSTPARLILAPTSLAHFRGRVRDATTAEPVPEFVLQVNGETLITDADGRFQTRALLSAGEVDVRTRDASEIFNTTTRFSHAPSGGRAASVEVKAEVGPTYQLRFELPAGLELQQFGVGLFDEESLRAVDLTTAELMQLRPGELPWVRLQPAWNLEPPASLILRSHGGGWLGRAQVAGLVGRQPSPIDVQLERRARMTGRVLDADGAPAAGAYVSLAALGTQDLVMRTRAGGNGAFVLRGVPSGACTLQAHHERLGEAQLTLEVDVDEPSEPLLSLQPYPIGGDVAGVVRSTLGQFHGRMVVHLRPLDPERALLSRRATIEWQDEPGGYVGEFEFKALAAGRYRLLAYPLGAPYLCEPDTLELSPPAVGLDLVVRDDVHAWMIYPVVWSSTGELDYEAVRITARVDGELLCDGPISDWPFQRRFRADERFDWSISAPGHVTASGDLSALESNLDRSTRRLRIELEPLE